MRKILSLLHTAQSAAKSSEENGGLMKKNELFEMEITGMTAEGNGVGRAEGMAVFVPSAAVGDVILCRIVKVLKSHCFGIIEKLLTPSEDRISADCRQAYIRKPSKQLP